MSTQVPPAGRLVQLGDEQLRREVLGGRLVERLVDRGLEQRRMLERRLVELRDAAHRVLDRGCDGRRARAGAPRLSVGASSDSIRRPGVDDRLRELRCDLRPGRTRRSAFARNRREEADDALAPDHADHRARDRQHRHHGRDELLHRLAPGRRRARARRRSARAPRAARRSVRLVLARVVAASCDHTSCSVSSPRTSATRARGRTACWSAEIVRHGGRLEVRAPRPARRPQRRAPAARAAWRRPSQCRRQLVERHLEHAVEQRPDERLQLRISPPMPGDDASGPSSRRRSPLRCADTALLAFFRSPPRKSSKYGSRPVSRGSKRSKNFVELRLAHRLRRRAGSTACATLSSIDSACSRSGLAPLLEELLGRGRVPSRRTGPTRSVAAAPRLLRQLGRATSSNSWS